MNKTIEILGTEYRICYKQLGNRDLDGWCDSTSHEIVIRSDNENGVGDFEALQRKQTRHEIIHAFLFESGLGCNFEHAYRFGHEETMIDWTAIQFPKLLKAFREVGCI